MPSTQDLAWLLPVAKDILEGLKDLVTVSSAVAVAVTATKAIQRRLGRKTGKREAASGGRRRSKRRRSKRQRSRR
jgi:hypothetical protein